MECEYLKDRLRSSQASQAANVGAPWPGAAPAPYRGIDALDPLGLARPKNPAALLPATQRRMPKTPAQISHSYELGLTSAAMSFHLAALENMQEVTALAPEHAGAWRALASLLRLSGKDHEADTAQAKSAALPDTIRQWHDAKGENSPAQLQRLDSKLRQRLQKIPDEERITFLRDLLFAAPLDVVAMRYLANQEDLADDAVTAAHLLERAIALSPAYLAVRADYAKLLMAEKDYSQALTQSEHLLACAPNNIGYRLLRADAAVHMERFDEAVVLFEAILKLDPKNPHILNSYGSVLKTLGRREECEKIFRTLLAVEPASGNAYFGLSELKANHLGDADAAAMRAHLAKGIGEITSRKCMAYALGQTLERAGDFENSFAAYAFGAEACKEEAAGKNRAHEPEKFEERLARVRTAFTADNLAARAVPPRDPPAVTPIFIVGMPRAGSTLVEQILASHRRVEATRELPVISDLTTRIAASRFLVNPDVYPKRVLEFDRPQLDDLGREVLEKIAVYRKTDLPFVIDKRPWNWIDAAFIHLILPQAKFIDIRRAPMAAGFAMFKQLLPLDASFSFDLQHLGHYYRHYVEFMDHLDVVMPGKILRVSYESLVDNTETEIRRMLAYCGLPFEASCLRFWETDRAVLTPSAEQVRQPIFRGALEQWKNYAPWLGPLKEALGDVAGGDSRVSQDFV